ncbi:MAG: c-type cytochrome [Gemmataceae bacterium]|nr:c-type cytochrome [Gemmataceae bacterium]
MNNVRFAFLAALGLAVATFWGGSGLSQGKKTDPKHDPANAVANLDVHPELEAQLFASEPMMTNPTNLDVDHRGRVWICDVKNYRGRNNSRPEGDRILILEDTDGDGKADKTTTFYQGRDVDSAMGICVLGNKVIVSATPNIWIFTKDDNDKIIKKEALFTKTGTPQHDHSAHSFLFGPDGKLYWNFGNTGNAVFDKDGKPVQDLAGNTVAANGKPYRQGMVFRCDADGSNFETLGWNFRNNYEVTVDSFGTLWQSDNDDDGNRGVRINYVMEFGNYGYVDEITGAGWGSPRTNMEKETPLKHWHLNDPGVVPNLLQTGAGSPTGICVYEGTLLPKDFQGEVIHCEPGANVVRAYPATKSGAGYKAKIVNILDGSKKNNFFRPADVCVGPDGSLYVTDWYDPGVGGHAQGEVDRGRVFRVAPKGSKVSVPKVDVTTTAGAAEALKSPNLATRYLAYTKLHEDGKAAEAELLKLTKSDDNRLRARAFWLLARIEGRGRQTVDEAIKDQQPDLRMVGVRMARELKLDVIPIVKALVSDKAPEVRRECIIALRHSKSPEAASLWAALALQHDGQDRWYLEALGIGADKQWDAYLGAYLKEAESKGMVDPAVRDVIWRSRAANTPELLAKIIRDPSRMAEEMPRFLRAFDFQPASEAKDAALISLLTTEGTGDAKRKQFVCVEAVKRLKNADPNKNAKFAATIDKILDDAKDPNTLVEIVGQFGYAKRFPELLAIAQKNAGQQLGVNATKALLERGQAKLLGEAAAGKNVEIALATVQALGLAADDRAAAVLLPIVQNKASDSEIRRQALRALAKTKTGAGQIIKMAQSKQLAEDLKVAAGAAFATSPFNDLKQQAETLFPSPRTKDDRPLPALAELVKMKGSPDKGSTLFRAKESTCNTCHIVNGDGKDVGPNLSEIGKKLSREAIWESILYPSAGIAHNYETYVVETKAGGVQTGLLVSNTAEGIVLKGADGIQRTFKKDDVEEFKKTAISLMPADLHKNLTPQDLADVVEYLATLKEARKK